MAETVSYWVIPKAKGNVELFLSTMSRARASRDLNILFVLSNWVVHQNFGLFVRILVCLPEFWFLC